MFEALLKLAGGVVDWLVLKEKNKYRDKLASLKKAYYEESNKPDSERSDAVLDNLSFELRLVSDSIYSSLREQNAPN